MLTSETIFLGLKKVSDPRIVRRQIVPVSFFPTSFACKLGVETGNVLVASGTKQLTTVADDL